MSNLHKEQLAAICQKLGIEKLKPFQKAVCSELMSGNNVIGLTRTSDGKTLCFMVQACLHSDALMLVITPTISLMRDQVKEWKQRTGLAVACLYTGNKDNAITLKNLRSGTLQVLFQMTLFPNKTASCRLKLLNGC
ncbi:DEAD/DEAH box helicase [Intestinibacillus massiliensis]|uniref:DEAD/DEAH box helicase n=1 Tax=Intestinibacillus massiliensis TaxID=1871029 RepID=UPI000B357AAE|nr:DEAD/DEAH box helicase [Intestinibacillus massiliensis]